MEVVVYNLPKWLIKGIKSGEEEYLCVYEGAVTNLMTIKDKKYYAIQWATCEPVEESYNIQDEPPDTIFMEGVELTEDEFNILYGEDKCIHCNTNLQFMEGHGSSNRFHGHVCADCLEEDDDLVKMYSIIDGTCC